MVMDAAVPFAERADGFGEERAKLPLKPLPSFCYESAQGHGAVSLYVVV